MVTPVYNRTKRVLINLLEAQKDCDVIFHLKNQVVIGGHSYILSAHSDKFICYKRDVPLVFNMDNRIQQNVMWIVLRYIYIGESYEIDIEDMDSYILLAYFFHNITLKLNADTFLLKTISKNTAFEIFNYAIDMKMSYICKYRIYEYIKRNVFKWPKSYTLDVVLMEPDVLTIAQHKVKMDGLLERIENCPSRVAKKDNGIRSKTRRWMSHIQRMEDLRMPKISLQSTADVTRPRGAPRKRYQDMPDQDFKKLRMCNWIAVAQNRSEWRKIVWKALRRQN